MIRDKESDAGKSKHVDKQRKKPTVEKPEGAPTPNVHSTTEFSGYVTGELYSKILMDALIRNVYDHELVMKIIRSEFPLPTNPLLKFPEPSTYENYDLHYLVSRHDKYHPSISRSLMFKERSERFLEEGIHRENFVVSEIRQVEFKLEANMGITGMNEATQRFFINRHREAGPRHKVYISHRSVHYLYVFSGKFRTDGFISYTVRRDDNLVYVFTEADYHNLHPQDIKDMYHSTISYLYDQGNDEDMKDSLKIFMRSQIAIAHVEDFQMVIEILQKKDNLSPPMITFPGIEEYKPWSYLQDPKFELGIIYENESRTKRMTRSDELKKFSSGTLSWVLEKV